MKSTKHRDSYISDWHGRGGFCKGQSLTLHKKGPFAKICTNSVTPEPPRQTRTAMQLHIKYTSERPKIEGWQCSR